MISREKLSTDTMATKIMLIACGSFNPPTPMHFRMFEIAKDHFSELGTHEVIGGIVSPVHDAYKKKGLVSQTHRLAMVRLTLESSSWIRTSEWECQQEEWTRTRNTLQYHQNYLNSIIRDLNGVKSSNLPGWLPDNVKQLKDPVQIKLLCGADLLESFATPSLWDTEDLEAILSQHGLVVITRNGSNPEQFIFDSDLLSKYRRNITIVTNWIANEVSSTLARRFIGRGLSVKYLLDDSVIDYINKHALYNSTNFETKFILPPSNNSSVSTILLTPISPESESSTFNDSYVKILNDKNESPVVSAIDDYESMDETDFPPPPPPLKSTLTVDYIASANPLQKVFCCASSDGAGVRLTRPGSAVQIHPNRESADKVGDKSDDDSNTNPVNTPDEDFGTSDNAPTPSPTSPAQLENLFAPHADDDEPSDSEHSLSVPSGDGGQSRFSPKTYNEMIKFVFTEHGIRVISDKEYVV